MTIFLLKIGLIFELFVLFELFEYFNELYSIFDLQLFLFESKTLLTIFILEKFIIPQIDSWVILQRANYTTVKSLTFLEKGQPL
jgi:hypothetical protein